jgi:flagellar basal-body rod protein FlgF
MQDALTVAVHTMHNALARVEGTGLNLTNLTTAGYKRSVAVTRSFSDYLGIGAFTGTRRLPVRVTLPSVDHVPDLKSGGVMFTGNALDFAVSGEGYFEVSTPSGSAYTRKGSFRLDGRGRLVTEQGYALMSQGGELVVTTPQPTVDQAGRVSDAGKQIGQIKVVQFSGAQGMVRLQGGLYSQGSAVVAPPDGGDPGVRQGYLEHSNVDSAAEMVSLIESMRHFEAAQKILQGYDDSLGRAIQKLGEL